MQFYETSDKIVCQPSWHWPDKWALGGKEVHLFPSCCHKIKFFQYTPVNLFLIIRNWSQWKMKFTKNAIPNNCFSQYQAQVFQQRDFSKKSCILHREEEKKHVKISSRAMPTSTSFCPTLISGTSSGHEISQDCSTLWSLPPPASAAHCASPPKPSSPYEDICSHQLSGIQCDEKRTRTKIPASSCQRTRWCIPFNLAC